MLDKVRVSTTIRRDFHHNLLASPFLRIIQIQSLVASHQSLSTYLGPKLLQDSTHDFRR